MSALMNYWILSKRLRKSIKSYSGNLDHINNLYWYDLKIKFAISLLGFMKIIFWSLNRIIVKNLVKPQKKSFN